MGSYPGYYPDSSAMTSVAMTSMSFAPKADSMPLVSSPAEPPGYPPPSDASLKVSILVWNLSANDGAIRAGLLAKALQRLGYRVEIVGFTFGEGVYAALPQEIPVRSQPGSAWPGMVGAIAQLLPWLDGDILYAIKPQLPSYGVALLKRALSRLRSKIHPVILDIDDWEMSWHGGDEWRYQASVKGILRDLLKSDGALRNPAHPLYIRALENRANWADAITIHTTFLQQRFGGVAVPNGKDIRLFDPTPYTTPTCNPQTCRDRLGLGSYRVLMFPGSSRPYKGVEDVLIALEQLNQPDLRLVIVGGSPYDNYDQALKKRWGDWLIQLPRQTADQMPGVIAAAHVIVVPQRDTAATRAQFPLKLTDGMAMAKPILAARVGDVPTILGGTGYLVDPESPSQIAERISEIFADYESALIRGQQSRDRCVQYYSLDAMAAALAPVLSAVLDPKVKP